MAGLTYERAIALLRRRARDARGAHGDPLSAELYTLAADGLAGKAEARADALQAAIDLEACRAMFGRAVELLRGLEATVGTHLHASAGAAGPAPCAVCESRAFLRALDDRQAPGKGARDG